MKKCVPTQVITFETTDIWMSHLISPICYGPYFMEIILIIFKLNFNSGKNFMRTFVFSKNLFEKLWPGYLPNLIRRFMTSRDHLGSILII